MARAADEKLAKYRSKRNFGKTPEPDDAPDVQAERQLVIQHHYARREHFDLRLEIDGVLASWAVTRGPSANPRDKRLAVRTEDHPLSYGSFEGTIPKGEYGGGTVILWEDTSYTPLNGPPKDALAKGEIKFESHGDRLKGRWVLVRMKSQEKQENWLLIKEKDDFVEKDDGLAQRYPKGVRSGLTREELENGKSPTVQKAEQNIPSFVAPMLCERSDHVPRGDNWAFELKYDGYRLELAVSQGECVIYTRTGLDWTKRFRSIETAARKLPVKSCLVDGEAVVLNAKGISDFPALVDALDAGESSNMTFAAFDILLLDGKNLRDLPYLERKEILRGLLKDNNKILFADYFTKDGAAFFKQAVEAGAEGIIAKRASSTYQSGRFSDWVKVKGDTREDVVIVGCMPSEVGESFASLLMAKETAEGYSFIGRVGTGFNAVNRAVLAPLLVETAKTKPLFTNRAKLPAKAIFLARPFSAEVRYRGWTADNQMRQTSFIALQADRPLPQAPEKKSMATKKSNVAVWKISSTDRLVFPDAKVTKGDIAAYYQAAWPRLKRHLANRPLSLLRVPEQVGKESFFQRHPLPGMTKGIQPVGSGDEPYFALDGEEGLETAVQFGSIELHGWNAVLPDLEHPDRVIFDLDPDEDLAFGDVTRAALLLRDYLEAAKLKSFPMLSGGKGVHLVVPLAARNTDEEVTNFAKQMAVGIAGEKPNVFVANMSKEKRRGRIFIDWLRNRTKSTAILPWSLRARPGATVATPVTWETLAKYRTAGAFTIRDALEQPDWEGFWTIRQSLPASLLDFLRKK